ncbi:MAG: DUF2125 domain-containing protein [Paracoccaceae bacterium]
MSRHPSLAATAAAALVLGASPALADLTPAQAWGALKGQFLSSGYTVTGTETLSDGALVIEDATMSISFPLPEAEGTGAYALDMGRIGFTAVGSDLVRVSFPPAIPMTLDLRGEDGEAINIGLTYSHQGLDMMLSGSPEAVQYAIGADLLALELTEVLVDGDPVTREEIAVRMDFNGVTAQNEQIPGDMIQYTQSWAIDTVGMQVGFEIEETKQAGNFDAVLSGVTLETDAIFPAMMDPTNIVAMLDNDMSATMEFAYTGSTVTANLPSDFGPIQQTSQSGKGLMVFSLADGTVRVATGSKDNRTELVGAGPMPSMSFAMDEASYNMSFPLVPSDTAKPFSLGVALRGLTISDGIWDMLDPARILPRDPATFAMQVSGAARLLVDISDPEEMARMEDGEISPAELESLSLDELTLSVAGAEMLGSGDFDFDWNDRDTFDGLPRPMGVVDVEVNGAQALIDNLIKLGLLSEEDALGARMMLTLFSVPGTGQDSLTSRIEVNEQGQVLANGMRVR